MEFACQGNVRVVVGQVIFRPQDYGVVADNVGPGLRPVGKPGIRVRHFIFQSIKGLIMRYSSLAIIMACALGMNMAHAEKAAEITFTGIVTDQTCKITIKEDDDGQVSLKLPVAHTNDLSGKGNTFGRTEFVLKLHGCEDTKHAKNVKVKFTNGNPVGDGYLKNTEPESEGANVAVQLLDADNNDFAINVTEWKNDWALPGKDKEHTHKFAAQYISLEDTIKPGKVKSVVTVDMEYH